MPLISVQETIEQSKLKLPEEVFDVLNEMIVKNWNGHESSIDELDLLDKIRGVLNLTAEEVRARGYLEIHKLVETNGWDIENVSSGNYRDGYINKFVFTPKSWGN